MSSLRGKYQSEEERQTQAASWAFRSVAEGIEHFKDGRHSEAFQCLNKALSIDPRNVEGLVARGALYANNGSFKKAVEDFENALQLNPSHANARKYMGETLVALGRSYEDENKIEEAKKAYQDCLKIIPLHEEAQNSLSFLRTKSNVTSKPLIELDDLSLPALNIKIGEQNRGDTSSRKDNVGLTSDGRKEKKSKKKKSKGRKRHSSSSSSSDSSESSESSSGESSSSSDSSSSTDSDRSKVKKKKKRSEKSRRSQSPLSKCMAAFSSRDGESSAINFGQSFAAGGSAPDGPMSDYDLRVSKFLEMTRDEDNYEEKVRKFVEEAAKYRKDRKIQEEKLKKKERKRSKKAKKDSKKKKKEKKSKGSKKDKDDLSNLDNMEFREALKIFTKLPIFDTKKIEDVEKTLNQLKEEERKLNSASDHKPAEDTKWKMIFSKESSKESAPTKSLSKQRAFSNDDDNERRSRSREKQDAVNDYNKRDSYSRPPLPPAAPSIPPVPPSSRQFGFSRSNASSGSLLRGSESSAHVGSHAKSPAPPAHPPNLGPSVLDKFGSFRRADASIPLSGQKPPEPPYQRRSRSRSRSRSSRSYSKSRSRSYSRRSRSKRRSRSYGRRSVSRRRSYSDRSRSRSGSLDPRRRRWRGGYRPRFGNNRGGRYQQARGGYRDFRTNRWGRGFGWGGGQRNNRFRSRSRNRNRSDSRGSRDSRSPDNRRSDRKSPPPPPAINNGDNENFMKKQLAGDPSIEEIDQILEKAKKDNKEEMLERNRDVAKRS